MTGEETTEQERPAGTPARPLRPRPTVPGAEAVEPGTPDTAPDATAASGDGPGDRPGAELAAPEGVAHWTPRHAAPDAAAAGAPGLRPALPRRAVQTTGRGMATLAMHGLESGWRFTAWRRTPVGGFVAPLLALALVVALAAVAGVALPHVKPGRPRPIAAQQQVPTPAVTASTPVPGESLPEPSTSGSARPVDGLTGWATLVSAVVGVPVPALKAYGYAQLRTALALPGCHLSWTTLAGIGKVESGHGTAGGATLRADGQVSPPIVGPVLDGQGGRQLVRDTDLGHYDGDTHYDRAIGPLQFLPATWEAYQADGDADGRHDPSDINDAALAAANYLCVGGRDLARPADWWAAVLAYNGVTSYAQSVFAAADQYGRLSRTVRPTTGG